MITKLTKLHWHAKFKVLKSISYFKCANSIGNKCTTTNN